MGLPNVLIKFQTIAASLITRSDKGIVAIAIKDAKANGSYTLTTTSDIPTTLGANNIAYIKRAFIGNVNPPKKVLLYVMPATATDYTDALAYFATVKFDYIVAGPDVTSTEVGAIKDWVIAERTNGHIVKAVLPNSVANNKAVINFTTGGIIVGGSTYTAAQYASRIAGLIAGTPMTQSVTYVALPEVTDCEKFTKAELDTKVDNGEFVIFNDGEKVKVGRGVNSLTTVTTTNDAIYKKIKIVEAMDLIASDIKTTTEDNYIGKFANSYDNKCILITAIKNYFKTLENDGVLDNGKSAVAIDMEAQITYLKGKGIDTDNMSEKEIKEANTDDKVFLTSSIKILDAIEDVTLNIAI